MTTGPWVPHETPMQFHVLSFEGPDAYARAGGIASRVTGLTQALQGLRDADIVSLRSPLDADSCRLLFHSVDAVLANSGHEPFGLVGLETMAAGGVACTGCSGEDYAVAGHNALVLETNDPWEFVGLFGALRANPAQTHALRQTAQVTARCYAWPQIITKLLLPRLRVLTYPPSPEHTTTRPPWSWIA